MGKFEAIPLIEPFLRSLDRLERREAVIAMGKFAKSEVMPQVERAAFGDPELEQLARQAKARIDATQEGIQTKKYQALVNAVIDTDEYEDLVALILVTWRPLLAVLEDETRSPQTRERAMRLLAIARAKKAGPPMRKILGDPWQAPELRLRAAYGMGLLRMRSAVPQLAELLGGNDAVMREVSLLSLGRIGDPRAFHPLVARWPADGGSVRERIRLAIFRVRSPQGAELLLRPLRTYQPRPIAETWFITDSLELVSGYRKELIEPYLRHPDAAARRDALLLLATFAEKSESAELQRHSETDADPLNREIAHLGVERLKDIPLWERE
jgi:HEAT repeat protein